MAWWFHPDRRDDFMNALEDIGALDLSVKETVVDGARHRILRWKDERGWEHIHSTPVRTAQDVPPDRQGDRFNVPASDWTELRHPAGESFTVVCNGRLEFVALDPTGTEIVVVHDHVMRGGKWRRRRNFPQTQQQGTEAAFNLMVERCRSALESATPTN